MVTVQVEVFFTTKDTKDARRTPSFFSFVLFVWPLCPSW
jgi:hypothetical protein